MNAPALASRFAIGRDDGARVLPRPTRGQLQILRLIAAGYVQREIAAMLQIGDSQVQASMTRLRERMLTRNTVETVALAFATGILDADEILRAQTDRRAKADLR